MVNIQNPQTVTQKIVLTATISALYAVLTIMVYPLSYGPIQVRFSEGLTVLPLYCPQAILGLSVGCMIANFFGNGILDIIFGTMATLISGILTWICGKIRNQRLRIFVGIIPPIVINALIVPFTFLALTELREAYLINMITVGAGQAIVLLVLGVPLAHILQKFSKKI